MHPVSEQTSGISVRIRAVPNAKKTEVTGIAGDRIKIRLHAPPVDGKANKELVSFLAKLLGVRKSACTITRGESARDKTVLIHDITRQQVESNLAPDLCP